MGADKGRLYIIGMGIAAHEIARSIEGLRLHSPGVIIIDDISEMSVRNVHELAAQMKGLPDCIIQTDIETRTRVDILHDVGLTMRLEAYPVIKCEPEPIDLRKVNEHPFEAFMGRNRNKRHKRKY